jgi:hypothetical protein
MDPFTTLLGRFQLFTDILLQIPKNTGPFKGWYLSYAWLVFANFELFLTSAIRFTALRLSWKED